MSEDVIERTIRHSIEKTNLGYAVGENEDDYDDIDALEIRPQSKYTIHGVKSKKKDEYQRSYHEGHHEKHSRKYYRDREKRKQHRRSHSSKSKHRERHGSSYIDVSLRSDHINEENKGDILGSRQSDTCKYDVKLSKDIRNSHRHSESHRKYDNDLSRHSNSHRVNYYDNDISKYRKRHRNSTDEYLDDEPSVSEKKFKSDDEIDEIDERVTNDERTTVYDMEPDEELSDWESEPAITNISHSSDRTESDNSASKLKNKSDKSEEDDDDDDADEANNHQNQDEESEIETDEEQLQHYSITTNCDEQSSQDLKLNADEQMNEDQISVVHHNVDETLPPYFPAIEGCRSVEEFHCLNRIEEGTYGVVYRFKDKRTDEVVALKKLKMDKEKEGFPITSLREINTLLKSQHPNIVTVREIVVGHTDKVFIVMDYVEHDLKSLIELMKAKGQKFMPGEIKCLLKQLLSAVAHLHDNWILHRDLKTSNLLLSHKGILKVGDFGLAREYGSPLKPYTPIVVTLWYRAPELLLGTKQYSTPIDMWSVGCIFAEFLLMHPIFTGKSEIEQLNRFFKCLGTPTEKVWPGFTKLPVVQKLKFTNYPVSNLRKRFQMLSSFGLNLLTNFLTFDPSQRITAEEALKHPYFLEFPMPIDPSQFPKWPAKSELGQRRALASSPKPPSGGGEFKKLEDEDGFRIGFENQTRTGAGFSLKF